MHNLKGIDSYNFLTKYTFYELCCCKSEKFKNFLCRDKEFKTYFDFYEEQGEEIKSEISVSRYLKHLGMINDNAIGV